MRKSGPTSRCSMFLKKAGRFFSYTVCPTACDPEDDQRDPERVADEISPRPVVRPVVGEESVHAFHAMLISPQNSAR
jgi:hypothetical protein